MVDLEKAISWQRYKQSKIMKVLGKSVNEPTWLQLLSHVCSFYGVSAVKVGNLVVDNQGLTLLFATPSLLIVSFEMILLLFVLQSNSTKPVPMNK